MHNCIFETKVLYYYVESVENGLGSGFGGLFGRMCRLGRNREARTGMEV